MNNKDITVEEILLNQIYDYYNYNNQTVRGKEKAIDRDKRLIRNANSLIDKFEIYLKTKQQENGKKTK